jgi:putative phosphoribosyl transferase
MKATRRLHRRAIRLGVDGREIDGDLVVPEKARALVLFAHGSGSGRESPRNRFVASALHEAEIGTLLIDLLTAEEDAYDERTRELRFDIDLLAGRVVTATDWLEQEPDTKHLPIGYFGASTGAAAAIVAAAQRPEARAIVSRGGRPDLAGAALSAVRSPTLLIVGGNDPEVLELNRRALEILEVPKKLEVVPGATHLFEEPGAIDQVARIATEWFAEFLHQRT